KLFGVGHPAIDCDRDRRRTDQLQPAERLGARRGKAQGAPGDLALSRGSWELGVQRQRDAALRAALHARRGRQVGGRPGTGRRRADALSVRRPALRVTNPGLRPGADLALNHASIPDWQEQLQASLRRAQQAIARGSTQQEQMVREWTESLRTAYPDWGRERWQRRLERKLRRRAEREARIANASLFEGYVWLLGAIVLFIVALSALPVLWWLIFPAAGLGSRGTRVIARHAGITKATVTVDATLPVGSRAPAGQPSIDEQSAARAQRFGSLGNLGSSFGGVTLRGGPPAPGAPPPMDPRDVRVDRICDKILAELRVAPQVVKEIFRKPEETIAALRTTCRDLTRRERDVRKVLSQ